MLKSLIAAAALATAVPAVAAAPALAAPPRASVHIEISPQGVDFHRGRSGWSRIDRRDAVRIAHRRGLSRLYDVDRRGDRWVVRGASRRGARLTVTISARDGRVLDVDYGRNRNGFRGDDRHHDHRSNHRDGRGRG